MFYMTSSPETGSQVVRRGDSGRMCSCQCPTNQLANRNCDQCRAMYTHNPHLLNRHSPTLEEQQDSSASVVCVRMNLGNLASRCGCQMSYKPRHGGGDTSFLPATDLADNQYAPTRGRHHTQCNMSGLTPPLGPRSAAPSSSTSTCALCQSDQGISNAKATSGSDSTSASSNNRRSSPRPGILRDNSKKSRTRARGSKSRSPSESSRTESSSSLNTEEKRKHKKHRRHKKAMFETPSSSSKKHIIKPAKSSKSRASGHSKSAKRQRSRRSSPLPPSKRSSTSSGFSIESSQSSISYEIQFQKPKVKHSSRKHRGRLAEVPSSENETTETEISSESRDMKRANEYLQDNLHEPQLCSVDFDCAKEMCRSCQQRRHRSDCMCDVCMDLRKRRPDCFVCSRCYIIPCSSSEHLRKVVTCGCCAKCSCIKCKAKSKKRDKHSRKHRHKHKHRRHPERGTKGECTQNHATTSSGSSHSGSSHSGSSHSGEQGSCSGSKVNTAPRRCSQFYQCDLLLGQCSTPTSGAVSVPL